MDVPEIGTCYVPEIGTDQQTLKTKQTSGEQLDPAFEEVRFFIGEKIFDRFMGGAKLLGIEEGVAVIGIVNAYAKDWVENRLGAKLKRALQVETVRCVVLAEP